ncbi:type II restriction endonuclease subunit M [Planotetraspora thailandica]|uniref:Type II restriction endonuclease subunit M n=1 Tax=Planotetraspora thailandica TaxID=487172 RepID=A0A8J3UYU0_9ACTN|nr:N-6 DNA methylase [Planotetraspora thailandica]GII53426.1 type II restriction endonuclease subunit M [Planotetraspora thailandica]
MRDEATVSATDIARLAGVRRAAVSNWRRRHADFPQPVGGTPISPMFALPEVEAWLRRQGKLRELPLEEWAWQQLRTEAGDDLRLAGVLGSATRSLIDASAAATRPGAAEAVAELAADRGPSEAFEFLLNRYKEIQGRRDSTTPPDVARLMAALAGDAETVLDPACGTGELLIAASQEGSSPRTLLGQDVDPDAALLASVRLALRNGERRDEAIVRPGDSLRADAFPTTLADAVLCDPPFHERSWGHDELTADPRWEYGLPPRLEPELAWVQHTLTHLAPGGHAVILMPAVAAGRRPGRRIRAQLLRTGALRAVVALSANQHIWLLRRPEGGTPATILMIDSSDQETVVSTWESYGDDAGHDEPAVSRAVPIIDLLDEEVDLTPARHLTAPGSGRTAERFGETHDRLAGLLGRLGGLVPDVAPAQDKRESRYVPVSELARIGHLTVHQAPLRGDADDDGDGVPLLTAEDVIEGRPASGRVASADTRWIATQSGDIVVAVVGPRFAARVIETEGVLLGPQLSLLRVDPAELDPHFLAGVLSSSANARSSTVQTTGGTGRVDVRRARVPRLPLEEQRRHGAVFRRMAEFESALRSTATLGAEMARLLADGVAEGTLMPSMDHDIGDQSR